MKMEVRILGNIGTLKMEKLTVLWNGSVSTRRHAVTSLNIATFRAVNFQGSQKKRVIYCPGRWLSISQNTILRYAWVRNLVLHTRGKTQLWVLVKRVMSNMFRPKREEVAGDWRKLHSEEFPDIKSSPNIIWVIKSRIRKAKHVARMGENRYLCL